MNPFQTLFKTLKVLPLIIVIIAGFSCRTAPMVDRLDPIRIYGENPFYWEYKGEPVLLVGGSREDNLFNHPEGLETHLELLTSIGGNYIRNTMSSRNPGNPWAFKKLDNGLYDLDQWNDEYWERFHNLVSMSVKRDIIIQVEIWDPWDYYKSEESLGHGSGNVGWESNPFNPALNINYTSEETGLNTEITTYPAGSPSDHLFFHTPPGLKNIPVVREYQEKFVGKILSITLDYPNILYCMNNETGEHPEWGVYWANYIREVAESQGREVYLADMRYSTNLQTADHRQLLHDTTNFDFFEVSQNNNKVNDQLHYDRLQEIREEILDNPKPLNNIKIYGGEPAWTTSAEEGTRRFWRNVFGGSASVRFHREGPSSHYFGIGLSELAQTHIRSMRMFADRFDIFTAVPANNLLSEREPNEAYCLAAEGSHYALYFPDGGDVMVDLSSLPGETELYWINITESVWLENQPLNGGGKVSITTPSKGQWAAVIQAKKD